MKPDVYDEPGEPGTGCRFIPSRVEIRCRVRSGMPAQDGTSIVTPGPTVGGEDPEIWQPKRGFPAGTSHAGTSHVGSFCWMGAQKLIKMACLDASTIMTYDEISGCTWYRRSGHPIVRFVGDLFTEMDPWHESM